MPTISEQIADADERGLVRKVQKALAVIAPTTVELPESLYDTGGTILDLKAAGFLPVGLISPDGYSFGREIEKEDVDALGYASPVRSDVTRVPRSVTFTALEKGRKHMLEMTYGTNLDAVTQDSTTGEIVFDEPDLPVNKEYRLLVVAEDGPADENWVMGKGFFRVKLSGTAEEVWGREGAVSQQFTLDVFSDDDAGVPVRHYLGGTGALAHKDVLGFTAGA